MFLRRDLAVRNNRSSTNVVHLGHLKQLKHRRQNLVANTQLPEYLEALEKLYHCRHTEDPSSASCLHMFPYVVDDIVGLLFPRFTRGLGYSAC